MTKRFMLSIASSALLLVGCGGGGNSTPIDPMTERDAVVIFYHYPADLCNDALKEEISVYVPEATDLLTRVEIDNVSCETYGKTNATEECTTFDFSLIDVSLIDVNTNCVVGANMPSPASVVSEDISIAAEISVEAFN